MIEKTHLWPEKTIEADDETIASVTVESPYHKRKLLWYHLPTTYSQTLTKTCDPFLLAILFTAMRSSTDVFVHGQVSQSLLRNLEEFQAAWNCWRPDKYTRIEIMAEDEQEKEKINNSNAAVLAFSGGVDSCFSAWRHHTGSCGRLRQNLQAAMLVHGFDIPIDEKDTFNRTAQNAGKMLKSLGIELITVATNFRELGDNWEDAHGAAIASSLMLLQNGYSAGLIASTEPYNNLVLPWGSNPVTDKLMSSDGFQIIHDGAAFTRSDKVREISNWPEALQYLRVCWEGEQKDRNCSRCEKCIRTILNFRTLGLGLPDCFEQDVSDKQILGLKGLNPVQIAYLEEILSVAKASSIRQSWVQSLEKCIKQNQRMAGAGQNLLQKIRKIIGIRRHLSQLTKLSRKWKLTAAGLNR